VTDSIRDVLADEMNVFPPALRSFIPTWRQDRGRINRTLDGFAYSYGHAFHALAEAVLPEWPKRNILVLPAVYSARQSMELWLKAAIVDYESILGEHYDETQNHSLTKLWIRLSELVGRIQGGANETHAAYCLNFIGQFDEIDPDGERCRFPYPNWPPSFELSKTQFENLIKVHWQVHTYADASMELIQAVADAAEGEEDPRLLTLEKYDDPASYERAFLRRWNPETMKPNE
jgi:hypothetical protein